MLLAGIRKRLEMAGSLPLQQLAAEARLSQQTLLDLLQPWLQRGRISIGSAQPACNKGCGTCGVAARCENDNVVQWLG